MIKTPIMAPAEIIPIRPKLSSSESFESFFNAEIPVPNASTKGTVRAPVVAPEASKAIARYSGDTNSDNRKINI